MSPNCLATGEHQSIDVPRWSWLQGWSGVEGTGSTGATGALMLGSGLPQHLHLSPTDSELYLSDSVTLPGKYK